MLKVVKDEAENATFTNNSSGMAATTIVGAIDELDGRVDVIEGKNSVAGYGITDVYTKTETGWFTGCSE